MANTNLLAEVRDHTSDTASGSWTQITNMASGTVSVASTSSVILLIMHVTPDFASGDFCTHYRFTRNGTAITNGPELSTFTDVTDEGNGVSMYYALTGISGNQTFEVEWITELGDVTADLRNRTLQVIEFTADATIVADDSDIAGASDPASWADTSWATESITVTASSLQLMLANLPYVETADASTDFSFAIGGTRVGPVCTTFCDAVNDRQGVGMCWAKVGQASGAATYSLQWQARGGSTGGLPSDMRATFQVIEFTDNFDMSVVDVATSASGSASTASFVDINALSGTITPDGTNSVVMMTAGITPSSSGAEGVANYRLAEGATPTAIGPDISLFKDAADIVVSATIGFAVTGKTASTKWALQWQTLSGKAAHTIDTGRQRTFQLIDFKDVAAGGLSIPVAINSYRQRQKPMA